MRPCGLRQSGMKNIFLFFLFIIGPLVTASSQTFIIAGQTTGGNIHTTDYEPDYSAVYPGAAEYKLDLDNNGTNDLLFTVHYHNNCDEYITWWTSVDILSGNVKIISQDDPFSGYVRPLVAGDTISSGNTWTCDTISNLTFQYYLHVNSTGQDIHHGEFYDGYMGYKIIHPTDTAYGWINVHASYDAVVSMENGIWDLTFGTKESSGSDNHLQIYPNPCSGKLYMNNKAAKNTHSRFEIFTVCGQIVKTGKVAGINNEVSTEELNPGLYFIKVTEDDNIVTVLPFIKQKE